MNELHHQPRCCDNPTPSAVPGLGTPQTSYFTIYCESCDTDLMMLDPIRELGRCIEHESPILAGHAYCASAIEGSRPHIPEFACTSIDWSR